jgi:hypothetical protein
MNELQRILVGNAAAAPPSHILEGLNEKLVHRKPAGAPHSIYEETWHIAYWLEMSLDWIGGTPTPYPSSASDGFPTVLDMENETWPALHARVLEGLEKTTAAAGETSQLNVLVHCPSQPGYAERSMTVREQLENLGAHNAYHFGRIVLLRQLMGCWPPPSGGDTW